MSHAAHAEIVETVLGTFNQGTSSQLDAANDLLAIAIQRIPDAETRDEIAARLSAAQHAQKLAVRDGLLCALTRS